jgi:hypothetical protein
MEAEKKLLECEELGINLIIDPNDPVHASTNVDTSSSSS